jgi:RNA polymerase sigma-70 factor (ECF subfamily)
MTSFAPCLALDQALLAEWCESAQGRRERRFLVLLGLWPRRAWGSLLALGTSGGAGFARQDLANLSDEQIVVRAQSCDDSAERDRLLGELYGRYLEQVVRWSLRLVGDEQEARDLAQDTFIRVHRAIDRFRGDSRFSTWLYTIVRRTAINRGVARRRRPTESLDAALEGSPSRRTWEPGEDESITEELHARRQRHQLTELMRTELDEDEIRVFSLHYGQGLTLVAITELLELSNRSGAKAILVRAQRKLRRALARTGFAESSAGRAPDLLTR